MSVEGETKRNRQQFYSLWTPCDRIWSLLLLRDNEVNLKASSMDNRIVRRQTRSDWLRSPRWTVTQPTKPFSAVFVPGYQVLGPRILCFDRMLLAGKQLCFLLSLLNT